MNKIATMIYDLIGEKKGEWAIWWETLLHYVGHYAAQPETFDS